MAQGKKRKARRGKATRSRETRARVAAKARPRSAKAAARKKSATTKTKHIVAKLTKPKTASQRQPIKLPIEVVKVERVDEPAPGVVVVSEVESVQVGPVPVTNVLDKTT